MENIKNILSLQDDVFAILHPVLPRDAVLAGGTALTRFYGFKHRFSEDIDIFFYRPKDESSTNTLARIKEWIDNIKLRGFFIEETFYEPGENNNLFNLRLIASKHKDIIKIDFIDDIFSGCWLPVKMKTTDTGVEFKVDNLEAILHKKLYAVYNNKMKFEKPRTKDIIDIYILFKEKFDFTEIRDFYKNARDIPLPFDSIMSAVSNTKLDFSEIINLDTAAIDKVKDWQTNLTNNKGLSL